MPIILGIILGVLFGMHDKIVIVLQEAFRDPVKFNYKKINRQWKGVKLLIVSFVGICLVNAKIEPLHIISFFLFFYVIFEISLNLFRGLPVFYVSRDPESSFWDEARVSIFGHSAESAEMYIKITLTIAGILIYKFA